MFWQTRRAGWETGGSTGAEIEVGLTGGGIEDVIEGGIVVPQLVFPMQQILRPVSGFSGFLALGSTMFVIFYSPGYTTGTL